MNTTSMQRLNALRSLVAFSMPMREIVEQLSRFGWDWEGEGVELAVTNVQGVLRRYLRSEISMADVENWANMMEGRDDVTVSPGSKNAMEGVLYELASPYLTRELSTDRAQYLLDHLDAAKESNMKSA